MRLRNIKDAEKIINESENVINAPIEYKGKWSQVFNNNNDIHIEVGMGKGDFIINKALANPDINFIGIEKYASVLVRAIEKINEDIPNLRIICFDANELNEVFNDEINVIYLNHSDPWPKVRHEKRRLTSKGFLDIYKAISKDKAHIYMKTDNKGLYEYSRESFLLNKFEILDSSIDYHCDDNILTEYESKFRKLGQPIYYLEVLS